MRRYIIHIILFILTVASTWLTWGPLYSITVMLILLGHEMGHYFMSRRHEMSATLPFFIPFPPIILPSGVVLESPFGTLGAVIRIKSPFASRKALFDMGVAGPLTSFFLSIPAIVIGLKLSKVLPQSHMPTGFIFSDPLLFSFVQELLLGQIPENYIVMAHPIAYAGWVGLFVTALNLLPVGQLDGGHITYALLGRKSRAIFFITIAVMAFITFFYNPLWIVLVILMVIFGPRHPLPIDDITPLDWKRKLLGGFVFFVFILSFQPNPFPQFVEEIKQFFPWF